MGGAGGGASGGGGGAGEVDAGTWAHTGLFETAFLVEPGVWASGPNDAWAPAASGQLFRWDGLSWTRGSLSALSGYCFSVWGSSPADVFIGCSSGAWFRSPFFAAHTAPGADDIHAIHGLSDGGSIYAVGSNWSLLRLESGDFVKVDAGVALSSSGANHGFRTVAVAGEHDIWLGGAEGTIVRGDGTSWAVVDAGVSGEVYRIWANAPNDVWFVGLKATVLHWNGTTLERPAFCSTCGDIYTAWGHSAGDMWFGDGNGGLRHWDGTTLTRSIAQSKVKSVTGVFGVGDHDLFAVGAVANGNSALMHFQR